MKPKAIVIILLSLFLPGLASAQNCVECHKGAGIFTARKVTPGIVADWELSKHSQNGVDCSVCHGTEHQSYNDVAKAKIPTPETCGRCHEEKLAQFKQGKHALAWSSMKALPTVHWQPMALTEGMEGCSGCHKIGLKTEAEIAELKEEGHRFGVASCDACHTRHTFSLDEARSPQACETCHMGYDHAQWEMYSSSKHGVRQALKQSKVLPQTVSAPTCQSCHMQEGNHAVRTAWGFLAVRLPMPEDSQWAADRTTVLQALGVLDPDGKPTPRLDVVKKADLARFTQDDWQHERDKMVKTCNQCHSVNFVRAELAKSDDMIRDADHLMSKAIRVVASLYEDGTLRKPETYAYPFPDWLTFHDAPALIEQKLFEMYSEHRTRTFEGAFHSSPDYELWYGWSEMQRDLTEINEMARQMRLEARGPRR